MENARAKQNVVFCVLILLTNLMALALIAASPRLRRFSKFHITSSMSVASIVASLSVFPLDTQEALSTGKSSLDSTVGSLLTGFHLYCAPSVLAISIVCLGIDFMVNRVYNTSLQRTITTSSLSILIPWSFGLLSLTLNSCTQFSIFANSRNIPDDKDADVAELYNLDFAYNNITQVTEMDNYNYRCKAPVLVMVTIQVLMWGFVPLILSFIVLVSSVVMHWMYVAAANHASITQISVSSMHSQEELVTEIKLMDTLVSMLVLVNLSIPFLVEVLSKIRCTSAGQCYMSGTVRRDLELAHWSVFFILPVLWMLDSEFRKAITRTCDNVCLGSNIV